MLVTERCCGNAMKTANVKSQVAHDKAAAHAPAGAAASAHAPTTRLVGRTDHIGDSDAVDTAVHQRATDTKGRHSAAPSVISRRQPSTGESSF
ncbi:hypothetical protein EVAR_29548_1 [Eumeta japonica]|uniref:Uncharacterized protein n=1 Tax=Eumeta variegata TaxID=151549 RepID=A0A4C1WIL2_EUMVA|nr:hypothetical protein EVAR_29548_1 [Eumeta japonica]